MVYVPPQKKGPIVDQDFFRNANFARMEGDWFAIDAAGRVAFFSGGAHGAIPTDADIERTTEAIEAMARAAAAKIAGGGYRGAGMTTNEPIFDPPASSEGGPLHEKPIDGYPHLVVAEDPTRLREVLEAAKSGLRETVMSRGAGLLAIDLEEKKWDWLHDDEAICVGCRAMSNPDDPQPRAPEVLARAGLYVFAHTSGDENCPYVRVASPSTPADLADLESIVVQLAQLVPFPDSFAEHDTWKPWRYVGCR